MVSECGPHQRSMPEVEDPGPSEKDQSLNEQPVTVVATRLKLRNWRQLRRFFRVNGEIKRQLKRTPGLIGYWLAVDFLRLRFSTLSVWEDDRAVDAFVTTGAHQEAIAVFDEIAVRDQSGFVRWVTADPRQPTWEEAAVRLPG